MLKGAERFYAKGYAALLSDRCRTDFADIQNKLECVGIRQWQNHYFRNWAAEAKTLSLFSGILVSVFVPFTLVCLRKAAFVFIILLEVSNGYSDY